MRKVLVFDWGGTFLKYALADGRELLEKGRVPSPDYSRGATKADFLAVVDGIVSRFRERVVGIAISAPGILDAGTGYMRTAGYLVYLAGSSLCVELGERYGLPVSVQNDGKCAALAELHGGSLAGCRNGAVVILGTGVGGGLVINGELYGGSHWSAGEYSFICTDPARVLDASSSWGITGGVRALIARVAEETGDSPEDLDGERIFARASGGEEPVLRALRAYTDGLAVQIYNINILLDLDVVAVGGGISNSPLLLDSLRQSMDALGRSLPLRATNPYIPIPRLTVCRFRNDANLLGAYHHFCSQHGEGE